MSHSFHKKVAIITGAAIGIGFEIAYQLAENGAKVVMNDIDESALQKAVQQCNENGKKVIGIAGDASDLQVIQQLINTAIDNFGQVNIAIANAGITTFGKFLEYTPKQFEELIQLNLKASFFLAQAAAKQIIAQKSGGRILLMSSVTGVQAHENLVAYGMTKGGLRMLAKGLVSELSTHQITVNTLAPGATLTERTLGDEDYEKIWSSITPIGRPASVADIAKAALFLVAPSSGHITGQTLVVDGGWTSISPSPF